jgi:hypothetical protein
MRQRWFRVCLVCAAGFAAVAVLHYARLPDERCFSICQFRRLTGLPCPTCGVTRALAMLAKGEWRCAIAYHPLSPLVAVALCGGWLYLLWCAATCVTPAMPRGRTPVVIMLAFLLTSVLIWIVRYLYPLVNGCFGGSG